MPRRRLILGGEASRIEFIRELRAMAPGCEIYNHYGPTETTVGVLTYRVGKELPVTATGNLPLGTPLPNSNVYLLDGHGDPVPPGTEGEIYISGLGVARGYLHQPELTAGRFLLDRFSGSPGGRMYRTGDLARCLPDGNLEFCGRIDDQVKIHGYRIELGEIECALREQPGVKDALVLARDGASGTKELVAYVVPKLRDQTLDAVHESAEAEFFAALSQRADQPSNAGPQILSPLLLRTALQERLLQQMVPAAFVLLSEFPLTANGKIDRHALSALTPEATQNSREFVAPRNRTEKLLAEIWSDLLKVENAGIHDDFFDLGGHSLLAIRAVSRIKDALGADLPLAALLHAPTIAQLAEMLRNQQYTPSWKSLVPLRASGSRPPLFLVHAHGGNVLEYNALARLLDADQPVYGIQARGLDGSVRPELTIEQMASEYLAEIRTLQPQGPYFLAGFCFGGPVALEIAQQIRQAGEEVGLLVLIQSTHPAVFHLFKPGISAPRRWWYRLLKQFDLERENTLHAGSTYLWRRARYVGDLLLARLAVAFGSRLEKQPAKSANLPKLFIFERLKQEHLSALEKYRPRQYDGKAILFRASKQMRGLLADETLGWSDTLLGPCEVCEVPGHQQNLMLEPNVQRVARELDQRLRATLRQYRYSKG
jgi:thioesterase domain-containing protein/acyl carrier protein